MLGITTRTQNYAHNQVAWSVIPAFLKVGPRMLGLLSDVGAKSPLCLRGSGLIILGGNKKSFPSNLLGRRAGVLTKIHSRQTNPLAQNNGCGEAE